MGESYRPWGKLFEKSFPQTLFQKLYKRFFEGGRAVPIIGDATILLHFIPRWERLCGIGREKVAGKPLFGKRGFPRTLSPKPRCFGKGDSAFAVSIFYSEQNPSPTNRNVPLSKPLPQSPFSYFFPKEMLFPVKIGKDRNHSVCCQDERPRKPSL